MSALLLGGCGAAPEAEKTSDPSSYPLRSARWSSTTIGVCWETSADGFPTEKGWVEERVREQFGRARLHLEGWQRCRAGQSGIHIALADQNGDNPHTDGLGRVLDGRRDGMELNFTFNHWSEVCRDRRKQCIESIAVHEFGHAIGLAHEQNRPDTPSTCRQSPQGRNGDQLVGGWDAFSVMNYCNPVYNNDGRLSAGDLAGIASMYGTRP